jgi:Flp pilus assembly protein TadG/uncharacterized protein YegL
MASAKFALCDGLQKLWRGFISDRSGNLALSFAILSIPLLGAMGTGIDYIRALNLHREIQGNLDAALVATVKDIGTKDDAALKQQLADWLAAEAQSSGSYNLDASSVVIDKAGHTITAKVRGTINTTFLRIFNRDTVPVAVQASIIDGVDVEMKKPFSMYLVLDRSGSMQDPTTTSYTTTCYVIPSIKWGPYNCTKRYTKIEALKLAVGLMVSQFNEIDPDKKYIRMGAVSYSDQRQNPTVLNWGTGAVQTYVNALVADGGTASTGAFELAYTSVIQPAEAAAHLSKNGEKAPGKYIVFMTDGDNNNSIDDTRTKALCDKARTDKVRVFSIAFMAPDKGQALLKACANTIADYFEADNTAALVAAFNKIGEESSKTPLRLTN